MIIRPQPLYKFKSIGNDIDLDRIKDVILNKRLFMPCINELNDPFESSCVMFKLAICGSAMQEDCGYTHNLILEIKKKFRALSFTSEMTSVLMWAHYTNDFRGCCLVFDNKAFKDIEPVIYTKSKFVVGEFTRDYKSFENLFHDSLLMKHSDWNYENEWRIIIEEDNPNNHTFYNLGSGDLIGVILGHKLERKYADELVKTCKTNGIPFLFTYTLPYLSNIGIAPKEISDKYNSLIISNELLPNAKQYWKNNLLKYMDNNTSTLVSIIEDNYYV